MWKCFCMLSSEYVLHDCIMYFPLCHICPEFNCKYLVVVYLHSTESSLTNFNWELLFKLNIIFFFSLFFTFLCKAIVVTAGIPALWNVFYSICQLDYLNYLFTIKVLHGSHVAWQEQWKYIAWERTFFPIRKNNLLLLLCNMAAVPNLYTV